MSIRIQKLEDALGIRLFERGPHEVTLTAEGRDLLPDFRAFVDMQDRMYERTRSSREFGSVRLGVAEGYEAALLPRLLKHMWQEYAPAELDIRCQPSWRLQQMIEARTLDLAVVTLLEEASSAVTLCRTPLHWVAASGVRPRASGAGTDRLAPGQLPLSVRRGRGASRPGRLLSRSLEQCRYARRPGCRRSRDRRCRHGRGHRSGDVEGDVRSLDPAAARQRPHPVAGAAWPAIRGVSSGKAGAHGRLPGGANARSLTGARELSSLADKASMH